MPSRINAEVDMKILADIGLGIKNKDIAENYKVSPSYVSKLKQGHKIPNIYIAQATVDALPNMSAMDKQSLILYLEARIEEERIQLNIHTQLLKHLKGEFYDKGGNK
jgi:uncharacterized protein involved in exopolysaccharide biosynthesis